MEIERFRTAMGGDVLHSWAADAQKEIERLRAELAECRNATAEDALRYAFIRAKHAADDDCWYVCGVGEADGDILDAKIDEARKGEGEV